MSEIFPNREERIGGLRFGGRRFCIILVMYGPRGRVRRRVGVIILDFSLGISCGRAYRSRNN